MRKIIVAVLLMLGLVGVGQVQAALPAAQVFIVAGSNVNMVSRESKIPVSVQNNYDRAIRVRVHARSTDPAVNVQEYVSLNIPANSRKDALVPVSVVSSGEFKLKVWVTTFTDIRLGKSTDIKLTANPDIEIVILVGFGILLSALIGLGGYRMLSRRKMKIERP
ncbi:MAG: hypothetical protein EBZ61_04745 [Micrococcales bacterium]|nr:hypothetical protein [Micrococcales bacterium]